MNLDKMRLPLGCVRPPLDRELLLEQLARTTRCRSPGTCRRLVAEQALRHRVVGSTNSTISRPPKLRNQEMTSSSGHVRQRSRDGSHQCDAENEVRLAAIGDVRSGRRQPCAGDGSTRFMTSGRMFRDLVVRRATVQHVDGHVVGVHCDDVRAAFSDDDAGQIPSWHCRGPTARSMAEIARARCGETSPSTSRSSIGLQRVVPVRLPPGVGALDPACAAGVSSFATVALVSSLLKHRLGKIVLDRLADPGSPLLGEAVAGRRADHRRPS